MIADFFTAIFTDIKSFFSTSLGFGGPLISGATVVWAIIIGFAAAAFVCLYNRIFIGKFVSRLLKAGADSPENALSPLDVGQKNVFLKSALRSNGLIKKIVIADADENEKKRDVLSTKYYIASENTERAAKLYSKNGSTIINIIFALILFLILAAIIYKVLPNLIGMTESFINSLVPESNIA